jgi:hypothetical protein
MHRMFLGNNNKDLKWEIADIKINWKEDKISKRIRKEE